MEENVEMLVKAINSNDLGEILPLWKAASASFPEDGKGVSQATKKVLRAACDTENLQAVITLAKNGADLKNFLPTVCTYDNLYIIKFFLQYYEYDQTELQQALSKCCQQGLEKIVSFLLYNRAQPDQQALQAALEIDNSKIVKSLLKYGLDPSPTVAAAQAEGKEVKIIKKLLQSGFDFGKINPVLTKNFDEAVVSSESDIFPSLPSDSKIKIVFLDMEGKFSFQDSYRKDKLANFKFLALHPNTTSLKIYLPGEEVYSARKVFYFLGEQHPDYSHLTGKELVGVISFLAKYFTNPDYSSVVNFLDRGNLR